MDCFQVVVRNAVLLQVANFTRMRFNGLAVEANDYVTCLTTFGVPY
jgi:hypothetical protein